MKIQLKKIIIAVVVCLLYILLRIGIQRASIETVDISRSPDGQYTLLLQSRRDLLFRRRYGRGRIVLEEGSDRIAYYDFTLYDSSGVIRPDIWKVSWSQGHVAATISGSDQEDLEVTLTMGGDVYERYLPGTTPFEKYFNSRWESARTEGTDATIAAEEPGSETTTADEIIITEEGGLDEAYQLIVDGYRAVFEQFSRSKGYTFQEDHDAKGNLRIILFEDEEKVEYLMYDRESENGKCGLYVYYSVDKNEDGSWAPDQARILDMYAWVYDTSEVISSGKTGWADPGSEAYRNATGE